MRVVSYTRTVSSRPSSSGMQTESIMAQNGRILDFAKAHGWRITEKYSDRKKDAEEDTAFQNMKADGIARKFECVVIDSMYLCGSKAPIAADLFLYVFLPAGIHFAVVEDNFVSAEMDADKAEEYLKAKTEEYNSGRIGVVSAQRAQNRKFPKYGYRFCDDGLELAVDENVADTVRDIFQLALEGHTAKVIAETLDARGVVPMHIYMESLRGRRFEHGYEDGKWNVSEIARILCNRLYVGEWVRTVDGKKVTVPCPAIIDKEIFDTVNGDNRPRKRKKQNGLRKQMPFAKIIVDRDSGLFLYLHTRPSNQEQILCFKPPVPKTEYEKTSILYADVEEQVMEQLIKECEAVKHVMTFLESESALAEKDRAKSRFVEEAQMIYVKMEELEKSAFVSASASPAYGVTSVDAINSVSPEKEAVFLELDRELSVLEEKIAEIETAFSRKNPWIKKFSALDLSGGITKKMVRECIERIECVRFEYVTVLFKEQEWRGKLPPEWTEEA